MKTSSRSPRRAPPAVEELPRAMGNPARQALAHLGITTLRQLSKLTEQEVLAIHGVGPKAVTVAREVMAARGLAFTRKGAAVKKAPVKAKEKAREKASSSRKGRSANSAEVEAPRVKASSKKRGTDADAAEVEAFMSKLAHPYKAELSELRRIILGANRKLAERIKWKVPSFHYGRDFAALHPRETSCAMMVVVFPPGRMVKDPAGILEGDYRDRRLAKFQDLKDLQAKRKALVELVNEWVALVDEASSDPISTARV